jgi:hypothetical protein
MDFGELQNLVKLDLACCGELECLPNSIMDLSKLKAFRSWGCDKLKNLPVDFEKFDELGYDDFFDYGV